MLFRKIWIDCPLGSEKLLLRTMTGREELGRPFVYTLELLTHDTALDLNALLGHPMTVHLQVTAVEERHFHGFVTELSEAGSDGSFIVYRVKLAPWFSLLGYNSNCRIFQEKNAVDIAEEIFKDAGFSDYEIALTEKSYKKYEYAVQYRESDFSFISRLLEQEGIYYFFEHGKDKHRLVLADAPESHDKRKLGDLRFLAEAGEATVDQHIDRWSLSKSIRPGTFATDDYDFKRPRAALMSKLSAPQAHPHAEYEIFDYPGEYVRTDEGETLARVRLQQLQSRYERMQGSGNVRTLSTGCTFKLTDFPREDQNQEYLIVATDYTLHSSGLETGGGDAESTFHASIETIKAATPFRPAHSTPRPFIAGHQTAVVVGKSGEEIWTDEYGRVKVQFRWDRRGVSDEKSSCWVRVAQVWAGSGWGAIHVPRIGQEVLVSFLDGDPDRPIITGRVYNGAAKPPFELPGQAMVSGIKSDSTPGGGGYNEVSMDDSKGAEKLTLHAQKDMETTVEHDQTTTVHNNRTTLVDVDDLETVGQLQSISVGADQSIAVGKAHTLTVGASSAETIALGKALTVGSSYQVSVVAAMNTTVGGNAAEEIGGGRSVVVAKSSSEDVRGSKSIKVAKDMVQEVQQNLTIHTDKKLNVTAADDLVIRGKKKGLLEFSEELTIKVGSASIVLKKNGDILLKGKKLSLNGSGDIVIKGQKVVQN